MKPNCTTISAVAEAVGLTHEGVRLAIKGGRLNAFQEGRTWLILKDKLYNRFVQEQAEAKAS